MNHNNYKLSLNTYTTVLDGGDDNSDNNRTYT